ncbi:hypothetical protein [Micromonospora sp. CA-248212]|uniref:hypothetical protein n=1 Tax=Micromonospora sp. CA-248212 TaxID=3239961 RepID=UPI003D8C0B97
MADRSIIDRAADIIEPHIATRFKRRLLAEGNAQDLARAGLLVGGHSTSTVTIRAQAEAVLQCRQDWPTAEKIAAELDAAGLLKGAGCA